jgi:hypothetical protein
MKRADTPMEIGEIIPAHHGKAAAISPPPWMEEIARTNRQPTDVSKTETETQAEAESAGSETKE